MDISDIKRQIELSKKTISEYKKQNVIFDSIIQNAIKGAREEDKATIEKVRVLKIRVENLAKQGKTEEAQNLIKEFKNLWASK